MTPVAASPWGVGTRWLSPTLSSLSWHERALQLSRLVGKEAREDWQGLLPGQVDLASEEELPSERQ